MPFVPADKQDKQDNMTKQPDPRQPDSKQPDSSEIWRLVYRAIWRDDRPDLLEAARKDFLDWDSALRKRSDTCNSGLHSGTQLNEGQASFLKMTQDTTYTFGSARTTLQVLRDNSGGWLWVDVDTPTENDDPETPIYEATQLIGTLIVTGRDNGGKPRIGGALLNVKAIAIKPEDVASTVSDTFFSPERTIPIVLFAHDPLSGSSATLERADAAGRRLAGVAQVLVLPNGTTTKFQNEVGPELDVQPGEARLYMPNLTNQLRALSAHQVRTDVELAGRRFLLMLMPSLVAVEPPNAFFKMEESTGLQRPAPVKGLVPTESGRPRESIKPDQLKKPDESIQPDQSEKPDESKRIAQLKEETEALWETLFKTRSQLKKSNHKLAQSRRDSADLSKHLLYAISDIEQKQVENVELQNSYAKLLDKLVMHLVNADGDTPVPTAMAPSTAKTLMDEVTSVSQALNLARKNLPHVAIPEKAVKGVNLHKLDNAKNAHAWGRDVMKGLVAFESYATSVRDFKEYKANHRVTKAERKSVSGFYEWCNSSDNPWAWPASQHKLAMTESEEVLRRPEFKKHRQMPVAVEVKESGVIEMVAHLKISNSEVAPRLYFHDDTNGSTGKIHIGYVGPHLPTKRFSK